MAESDLPQWFKQFTRTVLYVGMALAVALLTGAFVLACYRLLILAV